jgi:hypothetical protein
MLAGIIALYVAIIIFGTSDTGAVIRVALVGYLTWSAARLRTERSVRWAALGLGGTAVIATLVVVVLGSARLIYGFVGGLSVLLIATAMAAIASTLLGRVSVDLVTVLGVLCIYLMFALFFACLHQLLGAFIPDYLDGTPEFASPSDLLYFSVMTLATVGFGDITPVAEAARAVAVVEALIGQLYLVSVVAAVVAGWRSPSTEGPRT